MMWRIFLAVAMVVLCFPGQVRLEMDSFLREYNQQRRIEAFVSRLKRRFGPVNIRIGTIRRKEVWITVPVLNILTVAGELVELGLRVASSYVSLHAHRQAIVSNTH